MRIGSLCSGYEGLGLAVQDVFPEAELAWVSDIDKGACKILAHHYPDVPNLGDMTTVDWAEVEPVEVVTAGFPCQPVSHAGKRLGADDERWLWDDVAHAVSALRPGLVVLENVRGLLTAGSGRLFGRVLGSLAELGYDAEWHGLRAADIGAPHGRFRIFIVAHANGEGRSRVRRLDAFRCDSDGCRGADRLRTPTEPATLLPTPRTSDTNGAGAHGDGGVDLRTAVTLLPTPRATDGTKGGPNQAGSSGDLMLPSAVQAARWGDYAPAIARWEQILGRPAPAPTMTSSKGNPQLAPAFVEWMMGLPLGWVTDVPGLSRNDMLRALGNGVVRQQAAAALRLMLSRVQVAA